jgi:hypothetical protein
MCQHTVLRFSRNATQFIATYDHRYNVTDDMTEHVDIAASNPTVVQRMLARSTALTATIWKDKWTGYSSTCMPAQRAIDSLYGGFVGPFCDVGPSPPSPQPQPPGNFTPTPLHNCTYLDNTWISPATKNWVMSATTQQACCEACGMDPTCVASVLTCPKGGGGECYCNLKAWRADNTLDHSKSPQHTTLTCLTGRQNITG